MKAKMLVVFLVSSVLLAGCGKSNHGSQASAPGHASTTSQPAGDDHAFPAELKSQLEDVAGTMYLYLGDGDIRCWLSSQTTAEPLGDAPFHIFFKRDEEAWPQLSFPQSYPNFEQNLQTQLPIGDFQSFAPLSAQIYQAIKSHGALQYVQATNGSYPYTCAVVTPGSGLAAAVATSYRNPNENASEPSIQIARLGPLSFDRELFVAEYDQPAPAGFTTKHRSYKLFAHFTADPNVFGIAVEPLERDVVIYFDTPTQTWKLDTDSKWKVEGAN